ncbi:MAG: HIT domain-containing protein [Nanoarchaeota archaeon]|nr:HIT domain-containing protein [Nanoarchaeota archaeon]
MVEKMTEQQRMEEVKKQCPFCQIVEGNIPATKVYEDDKVIAILDINPGAKGHVLLMPKDHFFLAAMMPPDLFNYFFKMVKEVGQCVEEAMLSQGVEIFLASGQAAGQQSSHMMIHIVPREQSDDLSCFDLPENKLDEKKLEELRKVLKQNLDIAIKRKFGPQKKLGKKEVLQIIESNPQVKEMILKNSDEFKKMVPQNPQLQALFKDVDVDEIIAELTGEKVEKKEKKTKKKKKKKEEEKEEEETEEGDDEEPKEEVEGEGDEKEDEDEDDETEEEDDEEVEEGQKEDVDLDLVSKMFG